MRFTILWLLILCAHISLQSQDSLYTRQVLRYLTSEKCFGRGYLNNGLCNAEKYILKEIKKSHVQPLFDDKKFSQPFSHAVNTFPKKCTIKLNGKVLTPGVDYIPDASSNSAKGIYKLEKADSVTFVNTTANPPITVILQNKLTYTVARNVSNFSGIFLDKKKFSEEPKEIEINIQNKLISDFESRNIGCFIPGTLKSDSVIIFSAHYDHLGGIGHKTYFPGANDNASGVSVLLNLIRYYTEHPPKYKTIFIFFAGEEAGLLGSKHFVEQKSIDLLKIKFLVNLDLLGTGDDGIMVVNGAIHEKEFSLLNKINSEMLLVKEIKKRGKAANSDHYWFTQAGVPCFFIYTMGGIKAYHDVYDIEKTLPLTDYKDVFNLLLIFVSQL